MMALTVCSGYQFSSNNVYPCATTKSSYLFLVSNLFTPHGNCIMNYPKTMLTTLLLLSGWNPNLEPIAPDDRLAIMMQDQAEMHIGQGGK
jgi:hypothetical protein